MERFFNVLKINDMTKKSIINQPDQNRHAGKPDPKKLNSDPIHQAELHKRTNKKGYNEHTTANTPGSKQKLNEDKNDGKVWERITTINNSLNLKP
jgi:hypothetical protein